MHRVRLGFKKIVILTPTSIADKKEVMRVTYSLGLTQEFPFLGCSKVPLDPALKSEHDLERGKIYKVYTYIYPPKLALFLSCLCACVEEGHLGNGAGGRRKTKKSLHLASFLTSCCCCVSHHAVFWSTSIFMSHRQRLGAHSFTFFSCCCCKPSRYILRMLLLPLDSPKETDPRARSPWSRRYLSMQKKIIRTAARASIFPFNILFHMSLSSLSCPEPRFFVACLLQLCKAVSPSKEEKSTDKNSTHARSVVRRSVGRYAARKNFKMSLIRTREFFACLPVRLPAGPSDRWSLKKGRGKMAKLLFFISAADKGKTKRPSHVIQSYIRYKLGTLLKYI